MRILPAALIAILALLPCHAAEQATLPQPAFPQPVLPQDLRWFSPPGHAALQGAWVIGAEERPGAYLLRVRLAAGGRVPPHAHPDERSSTVLAGTLYVGFGSVLDESRIVAVPAGGVYVAPAGVAHYHWAKDGEVVYQEAGFGPTSNLPAKP